MSTLRRQPASVTTPDFGLRNRVMVALFSRIVIFALLQSLVAGIFALAGNGSPWATSVPWWPVTVTLANLVSLGLLRAFLAVEGRRFRDLLRVEGATLGRDVLGTLGLLVVAGVLAMGPNLGLGALLWGDPEVPVAMFVGALPLWVALLALVGFPLTIALSELPTYYGYVRPRLETLGLQPWQAVCLAALLHGLQHATLPLIIDWRFILWRALMFLPFAVFVAAMLRWRPRLLPYLMVAHGLLDLSVAAMILQASLP